MPKISALPAITTISKEDTLAIVDDSAATTKKITLAQLLGLIFPIGTYYTNETDSTNPGTLFGFGTWVAAAVGRVPVGKAASGTFGTAGATGGAETVTLGAGEIPAHTHNTVNANGGGYKATTTGTVFVALDPVAYGANVASSSYGGGGAHNNLQPYIVVYTWKRTA